ncbi:hypothetical protein L198_00505 [Cryptococcus wingfieldii CBS 7118]|uniref:Cytochrome P450 n=1 Tax=Cryptococcus wingfieldii CBS 7118 TaxID=1295528 RepID=A0A1E3K949_9TREE|nr:hypothetical protein L198_00505 [Cryptococcus wingfieldii CBS 7118]ODO08772.1 hypothetical protein L198_00505 [Cryptococcus wingfieldii CBS 7118]
MLKSEAEVPNITWARTYSTTFRYRFVLGVPRLVTIDPSTINYVLSHPELFPKPDHVKSDLISLTGGGLLAADGETHHRQRRLLNACFNSSAVRGVVPIFYDKAYELRQKLLDLLDGACAETPSFTPPQAIDLVEGARKIDMVKYLSRTTLDIIGLAGFGYDFKQLQEADTELSRPMKSLYAIILRPSILSILQTRFPLLRSLPTARMRAVKKNLKASRRVGERIVREKKAEALLAGGLFEKGNTGKDLISLLIQANMDDSLPAEQRLSDREVVDQITTFMAAGNDTTSIALTWSLRQLVLSPTIQDRLREEFSTIIDDRPDLETLNALPYLEAFIREVLRHSPPAPSVFRSAREDHIIPLGMPILGRDGNMIHHIKVPKGTSIQFSIATINTSPIFYGADAADFNPDRFLDSPKKRKRSEVPGVWGGSMVFFSGPHHCIGYRFALAEIKTILFVLLKNFEFAELPSKPVIERKAARVMRPRVVGEEKYGPQLPLLVKALGV